MASVAETCATLPAVLLSPRLPAVNPRGPLYTEQALAAIHQGNPRRHAVTLLAASHAGAAGLFVRCPTRTRSLVEGQLLAHYPDLAIDRLPDGALDPSPGTTPFTRRLYLTPYLFPIRRYTQFTDEVSRTLADPLSAILAAVRSNPGDATSARVEIEITPAPPRMVRRARGVLRRLLHPLFERHPRLAGLYVAWSFSPSRLHRIVAGVLGSLARAPANQPAHDPTSVSATRTHDREDDKQAAADKLGRHCFSCYLTLTVYAPPDEATAVVEKLDQLAGAIGQFSVPRLASFEVVRHAKTPPFLLSAEELATLWHFPVTETPSPSLATLATRQLEPPIHLPTPSEQSNVAVLGETLFRDRRQTFGILAHDKSRHLALLGKTGQGKTTLLEQLILTDMRAGHGLVFVDPHGDAVETLVRGHIPRSRTSDVVLFDPADATHSVALNLLECPDPVQRPLVASAIVSSFKKVFHDSWGPRLQYVLTNSLLALLEAPDATLTSVVPLLSDARYRQSIVAHVRDPAVRSYWLQEFETLPARLKSEWTSPVLNKLGPLVTSPILRNVFGQPRSTLRLREALDSRKVILCPFSKGRLGEDTATLLGALFVSAVQIAVLSRADQSEHERVPTTLYLDEFHSFATESFATALSESRKYALACVLATQFLEQVDDLTLAALAGNVGSLVSFAVGQRDAETVAEMLGAPVMPEDLLKLPQYQAVVRLLIDGYPSTPFSMRTLPLAAVSDDAQHPHVVRKTSQYRYARPREIVERQRDAVVAAR